MRSKSGCKGTNKIEKKAHKHRKTCFKTKIKAVTKSNGLNYLALGNASSDNSLKKS